MLARSWISTQYSREIDNVSRNEGFSVKWSLSSLIYHSSWPVALLHALHELPEHRISILSVPCMLFLPPFFNYSSQSRATRKKLKYNFAYRVPRTVWEQALGYPSEVSTACPTLAEGKFLRSDFIVSHRNFISRRRNERARASRNRTGIRNYELGNESRDCSFSFHLVQVPE